MAPQNGDFFQKAATMNRKGEKNSSDNPFLSKVTSVHVCIWIIQERINKLPSISYFLWSTFSNSGIVQEWSLKEERPITINSLRELYLPRIYTERTKTFSSLLKCESNTFSLTY